MPNTPKGSKIIKRPKRESPFLKSSRLQLSYERSLRSVAREVNRLIKGYDPKDIYQAEKLKRALFSYADILEPWARNTVGRLLDAAAAQDARAWKQYTTNMGTALRNQVLNTAMGDTFKKLLDVNIQLIKSIPIEAAQRVNNLVTENIWQSARPEEIATKIMETEKINFNRAMVIARTEVSRASATLTQARAESVGSEGYIWRTSNDLVVRESHKKMNGKFVKWTEPPILDKMVGHAGCLPNCRCYAEPIIPE